MNEDVVALLAAEGSEPFLIGAPDGTLTLASQAFTGLTGLETARYRSARTSMAQVLRDAGFELSPAEGRAVGGAPDPRATAGDTTALTEDNGTWSGTLWLRDGAGVRRPCAVTAHALGAGGRLVCIRPPRAGDDHSGDAYADPLTGLPGQALFRDRLEQNCNSARREGRSVAILLLGLDNFSLINDALGLAAGDTVLKHVAERLLESVRRSDTVARLEGDRFVVVTPVSASEHAVIVAEKLRESLARVYTVGEQEISLSTSIGVAVFPFDGKDPETLLRHADGALREAKRLGGNRYQFYGTDMNERARQRLETEQGLRRALVRDEFRLYYQPKVAASNNRLVGAEALIRWHHPERGLVPPGEFIPVAEETGLIKAIGNWVLREACRQSRAWEEQGMTPVPISVNVSPRQFRDPDFVAYVDQVVRESGIAPGNLELEITESSTMGDEIKAVERLHALRALGLRLSIDDFGTGYSNLGYLARFPVTTLKIDRTFVRGAEEDASQGEIARAIIGLSHNLQLDLVAEGAETVEHVSFLQRHGCDTVQGFYFSRPLPADTFAGVLATGTLVPGGG